MENNNIIQMLGKIITVEEISKTKVKDVFCGKYKYNNNEVIAYIIDKDYLKVKNFCGKVVSIIELREKNEYRIVVDKEQSTINYSKIKGFLCDIDELNGATFRCLYEISAGTIPYKIINDQPYYLVIYSKKNIPGFPKGHIEFGEEEEITAKRETLEEVGIKVDLKDNFRQTISYIIDDTVIHKEVVLYLAEISESDDVKINPEEINKFEFLNYNDAKNILNAQLIEVLNKAQDYINKSKCKK